MATLIQSELDIAQGRFSPQWLAGFFDGKGKRVTLPNKVRRFELMDAVRTENNSGKSGYVEGYLQ
jgi:hypothetical protein